MLKPTRFALDLSLLFDLSTGVKSAWASIEYIKKNCEGAEFLAPPTVQQALVLAVASTEYEATIRDLARTALMKLRLDWKFSEGEIKPADLGVCFENAKGMIAEGLLGNDAWNSAHTVAESACLGCQILLSHDPELLEISYPRLRRFLDKAHRDPVWITTPAEIHRQLSGG